MAKHPVSNIKDVKARTAPVDEVALQPAMKTRPPARLDVTITIWKKGLEIHRVHSDAYQAEQFNPGVGNARFSPISDTNGISIPTLYGGASFACAARESFFHDVPYVAGLKTVEKNRLDHRTYSVIVLSVDLKLVDLSTIPLRKLGIERKDLIDTEKDRYPDTRLWAEAIHAQHPDVHGLYWVSRQDDTSRALMLFGDRINPANLAQSGGSRRILGDIPLYEDVLCLARKIGVSVV